MDIQFFTTRFSANAESIERLLKDVDEDQARWKPAPDKWSILDVVCHLVDEEKFDFRVRLDYTVNRPGEAWPAIDPQGWVVAHGYAGKDLREQLILFLAERYKSIEWLGALRPVRDWNAAYDHPVLGRMTAGGLLGSWLAHDYLHLRQLSNLNIGYLAGLMEPHSLSYADPNL